MSTYISIYPVIPKPWQSQAKHPRWPPNTLPLYLIQNLYSSVANSFILSGYKYLLENANTIVSQTPRLRRGRQGRVQSFPKGGPDTRLRGPKQVTNIIFQAKYYQNVLYIYKSYYKIWIIMSQKQSHLAPKSVTFIQTSKYLKKNLWTNGNFNGEKLHNSLFRLPQKPTFFFLQNTQCAE